MSKSECSYHLINNGEKRKRRKSTLVPQSELFIDYDGEVQFSVDTYAVLVKMEPHTWQTVPLV